MASAKRIFPRLDGVLHDAYTKIATNGKCSGNPCRATSFLFSRLWQSQKICFLFFCFSWNFLAARKFQDKKKRNNLRTPCVLATCARPAQRSFHGQTSALKQRAGVKPGSAQRVRKGPVCKECASIARDDLMSAFFMKFLAARKFQ